MATERGLKITPWVYVEQTASRTKLLREFTNDIVCCTDIGFVVSLKLK